MVYIYIYYMSLTKLRSNNRSFQIKLGNFYPKKMALTVHSSVRAATMLHSHHIWLKHAHRIVTTP